MSESPSLRRPRFFSGKLVTPADLELQQQYFREKLKRHNRSLHGFGIVSGLKVSVNSGQILVESGLALDCEGNELAIETAQTVVAPPIDWRTAFVNIRFVEEDACLVPSPEPADDPNLPATVTDSFELVVTEENSNRGHRHLRARWLACGRPHVLTIARLRHSSQGWRVDRGYRAPVVK